MREAIRSQGVRSRGSLLKALKRIQLRERRKIRRMRFGIGRGYDGARVRTIVARVLDKSFAIVDTFCPFQSGQGPVATLS